MQIFLPAIAGYVPDDAIRCVSALLDFAYLAWRSAHDTDSLEEMEHHLDRFHRYRHVFADAGVVDEAFKLPRQHSLVHYVRAIYMYGSPNGLCTSITESKHIDAVKKPWRRSRRYKALLQILRTNTRLSKIRAARAEFGRRGMLTTTILEDAHYLAERRDLVEEIAADLGTDPQQVSIFDLRELDASAREGDDDLDGMEEYDPDANPDEAMDAESAEGYALHSTITLSARAGAYLQVLSMKILLIVAQHTLSPFKNSATLLHARSSSSCCGSTCTTSSKTKIPSFQLVPRFFRAYRSSHLCRGSLLRAERARWDWRHAS
jgi:hypothetical protein